MNRREWRHVARPIVWDLAAVLEEYGSLRFEPRDLGDLYPRFRAAAEWRDPEALRRACREIGLEARRRMAEREDVA